MHDVDKFIVNKIQLFRESDSTLGDILIKLLLQFQRRRRAVIHFPRLHFTHSSSRGKRFRLFLEPRSPICRYLQRRLTSIVVERLFCKIFIIVFNFCIRRVAFKMEISYTFRYIVPRKGSRNRFCVTDKYFPLFERSLHPKRSVAFWHSLIKG